MKALILAAGLGTRLRPLTENIPKALVPFKGVPLLERIIRNLFSAGVDHIVVNVHHFAPMVKEFLEGLSSGGLKISVSDESEQLMDTGGAILFARDYFRNEKDFIVHNVDVITSLDIGALLREHRKNNPLATIAVKKRPTSRSLLFNPEGELSGWRHNETGEEKIIRPAETVLEDFGNSCIQVINAEFFEHFPRTIPENLTNMYLELAGKFPVRGFVHNEDYWYDLGRYENYLLADKEVL